MPAMCIRIDSHSDMPIYAQIAEQVRFAVASGELAPGTKIPTVRSLAAELGVHVNTVAHAYSELERAGVVRTRPGAGTFIVDLVESERLSAERESRLTSLLGRAVLEALSLGYSLEQIEASMALRMARWQDQSKSTEIENEHLASDVIVAIGSHDLVLDMLAAQLRLRKPKVKMISTHVGSMGGLIALARGEAHLAGCHLMDEETGQYNLPYVKRVLVGQPMVLVNLVERVQGLMVRRGNPKGIRTVTDLARPDVMFVNRQGGSGTRVLLEQELQHAGIELAQVQGAEREEKTHLGVAATVAGGSADVGLGILSAARALELDFIPLGSERYDLVIPRQHYESKLLKPLLEIIRDASFQRVVAEMGGYDVALTGQIVGET